MKALIKKIKDGEYDYLGHRGRYVFCGPGTFKVSCPPMAWTLPVLAEKLRKPPKINTYSPPRPPSLRRAAFNWAVVRRFLEDSEPENALAYLDLYDREPVITHGGSLLTRVEWVEHRGLSVAIGQVWTGCRNLGEERPRWIWTSCEKYSGRTAHGRFSMPNAATARIAVENTLGNAADHMLERVKEETEKARSEGTQHANLAKFLGVN